MANLAIAGASGRMGRMLFEAAAADRDCTLVGALDAPGSPALGVSARVFGGNADVLVTADVATLANGRARATLIDFTRPEATLTYVDACVTHGVAMVIGTTGLDDGAKAKIADAARKIPIVFSPNYSLGVNTVFKLLELAAKSLDSGYDVEILEMHHRMKVDAPSGTAKMLGEAAAAGAHDRGQGEHRQQRGHEAGAAGRSVHGQRTSSTRPAAVRRSTSACMSATLRST